MSRGNWLYPLTGVLFIVLLFAGFVLAQEPPDPTDESIQEVVDFYVDNEGSIFAGSVLQALAGAVFIFFGGYLFKAMRAAGAESSAVVTVAGIVVFALGVAIDGTINVALAEGAEEVDPVAMQALSLLWTNDFLPFAMGLFVFLAGLGTAIVRHGLLPRWTGWIALVAALTAISPAFFVAGGVAALLVLATSVMLSMRERKALAA